MIYQLSESSGAWIQPVFHESHSEARAYGNVLLSLGMKSTAAQVSRPVANCSDVLEASQECHGMQGGIEDPGAPDDYISSGIKSIEHSSVGK